jgi:hypothetical protein
MFSYATPARRRLTEPNPGVQAMRYVVQQLPNGVDRLVSAALLDVPDAIAESKLSDREPLAFPHPPRLVDVGLMAAATFGYCPEELQHWICGACVRPLADDMIEVLVWPQPG